MLRGHAHVNGRFTHRHDANPVNHPHCQTGVPGGDFLEQPPDFPFGHFRVNLVFQRRNRGVVFCGANDAAKFRPRADTTRFRGRDRFRNRRLGELQGDFHGTELTTRHRRNQSHFIVRVKKHLWVGIFLVAGQPDAGAVVGERGKFSKQCPPELFGTQWLSHGKLNRIAVCCILKLGKK